MTLINLRDIKDEQTIQEAARAAIETCHARPDTQIGPGPAPITPRGNLDVDAVLARSFRGVEGKEL